MPLIVLDYSIILQPIGRKAHVYIMPLRIFISPMRYMNPKAVRMRCIIILPKWVVRFWTKMVGVMLSYKYEFVMNDALVIFVYLC